MLCGDHAGPFIDTGAETIEGHVYICAATDTRSGCVRQMARHDGCLDPVAAAVITNALDSAQKEIERLQRKLVEVAGKKELSTEDFFRVLGEQTTSNAAGGTYSITFSGA